MDKPVTLGFVGCGNMGQMAHIANYAEIPGIRLKALVDVKQEQARKVAARYGIEQVYGRVEEIAADPEIDGVVCIMFWGLQEEPAIQLLRGGKHVIVEKPLAGNAAAGGRMVEAARQAGKHLVCGYMKCHDAGIQWARQRIQERGRINQAHLFFTGGDWWANLGKPITTQEEAPQGWGTSHWMPPGLSPAQQQAFSFFINIYSHHLGVFRFLLGQELKFEAIRPQDPSETVLFSAGDTQVVLMRTRMACDWWEEKVRVVFDDGYVEVAPPPPMARNVNARVEEYRKGAEGQASTLTQALTGWNWAFKRQAEHFVQVCAGQAQPLAPGEHAWRDLVLMEEMARAYPAG